ncbi:MAG: TonB-dependent receptor [Lutimonas sp.]
MAKHILLFIFSFLFINHIISQRPPGAGPGQNQATFEIKGIVHDKTTDQALEYATIVAKPISGTQIFGGITDSKGNFSIDVPQGTYLVTIEFISFKTKDLGEIIIDKNIDLGTVVLEEDAENLEEVQVIAEKSTVEIKLDKKIYNVGKDMTVKGGNAIDVLNNVPSVTVDVDGAVSLRGNENVRILINGRPNNLVGGSDNEALRQFSAEMIEKVEVITSPSARYDAEGTAGIVNIILRKGSNDGFNANATIFGGYPENAGGSVNLNYRKNKFNFFNNTGYSYSDAPGNASYYSEFFNNPVSPFVKEKREYNRVNNNINTNFGVEYFITDKSSIVASFIYRNSRGNDETVNETTKFDSNLQETDFIVRTSDDSEDRNDWQYNLNYMNNFNENGHKLTVDFQFEDNYEKEFTDINEKEFFPVEQDQLGEQNSTERPEKQYLFQSDYVLPMENEHQFEAGVRSNILDQTTDFRVYFEDDNGDFNLDTNLSNIFNYDEKIHAAYTQYGAKFNKFSGLLGLRMEITDIDIEIVDREDLAAERNYTNWFPTVNLGYELADEENITIGYNRRIRRPRSRMINPFPSRSSETNIFQGNPYLNPSISDAFEIGYFKKWPKITLNTSVYYNHATDVFQFITEDTGETTEGGIPIIKRFPINLSTEDRYGFEMAANYTPKKNWRFNASFNLFQNTVEGFYEGVDFGAENLSWFTRLSGKVVLPYSIDWQTNMMYMGPMQNAQNEYKGMFSTDMAFSKDIMDGDGTLSLNISDLFNSRKRMMETSTDTFYSESEFQWRERQFRLTFTYRFKQKKKREFNRDFDGGGDFEMMGS